MTPPRISSCPSCPADHCASANCGTSKINITVLTSFRVLFSCDSFGAPIGDLPKQTDSGFYQENNLTAGTWECEPGKLQLDLDITEFCHLLKGHC